MKKLFGFAAALLLLGGLGAGLIYKAMPTWETRAQFGDMFGAVNALFSTLALVGVVAAIFIQKEELTLQRRELEMTRDELQRSASAHEGSAQSLATQLSHQITAGRINGLSALLASIDAEIDAAASDATARGADTRWGLGRFQRNDPRPQLFAQRNRIRSQITRLLVELGEADLLVEPDSDDVQPVGPSEGGNDPI
jgi:hypothetical protein